MPATPTPGDLVTLTVPHQAVGLAHADTEGRFEVEHVSIQDDCVRLHVTPEGAEAPRYQLHSRHVEVVE